MRTDTEQYYKERLLKVLVHLQRHLDENPSLDELAQVAAFSPYHFHRIFRGMVGESVAEHVRRLRLERAAGRLKLSDQSVLEIALEAGYESHEGFTRAFHEHFGEAPSRWRELQRAIPYPSVPSNAHYAGDGELLDFIPQRGASPMDVRIETRAPQRVAFMRHVGPYAEVGKTWMKFMMWAGMRGLVRGKPVMLGMVHDDPAITPEGKIRYDACLPVNDRFQPKGEVGVQEIAGGEYAVTVHRGAYDRLGETYARLFGEWLAANGREPRNVPCFEVYLNNPQTTRPDDLLTEIWLPLAGGAEDGEPVA